jgi:superfamily II DNA/RNA helicase
LIVSGSSSVIVLVLLSRADVDDIKYVINFDYPNSSEDYVHRIGRTARAEKRGTSYTFFTVANARQAKDLVGVLQEANQQINPKLLQLRDMASAFGRCKFRAVLFTTFI